MLNIFIDLLYVHLYVHLCVEDNSFKRHFVEDIILVCIKNLLDTQPFVQTMIYNKILVIDTCIYLFEYIQLIRIYKQS